MFLPVEDLEVGDTRVQSYKNQNVPYFARFQPQMKRMQAIPTTQLNKKNLTSAPRMDPSTISALNPNN